MSLLSSFIQNQLLKALEAEFLTHTNELQELFLKEVHAFAAMVVAWVESKLPDNDNQPPTEK